MLKEDDCLIAFVSIEVSCYSFLILIAIVCNDAHRLFVVNNSRVGWYTTLFKEELRAETMHITYHQLREVTSYYLLDTVGHLPRSTVGERKTEHILILNTPFSCIPHPLCKDMSLTTSWRRKHKVIALTCLYNRYLILV